MTSEMDWNTANTWFLSQLLDFVREELEQEVAKLNGEPLPTEGGPHSWPSWPEEQQYPPSFYVLCQKCDIGIFGQKVLLLCIGMELDSRIPQLCAQAQGEPDCPYPTFSLALRLFKNAHWDGVAAHSAIRSYRLVEIERSRLMMQARIYTDERVWQAMLGINGLDRRLQRILEVCDEPLDPPLSHLTLSDDIAHTLVADLNIRVPIVQLCGRSESDQLTVAQVACASIGCTLYRVSAVDLPETGERLEDIIHLWERECALSPVALFLDCHTTTAGQNILVQSINRLVNQAQGLIFIGTNLRRHTGRRNSVIFDVDPPLMSEQHEQWRQILSNWPAEQVPKDPSWVEEISVGLKVQFAMNDASLRGAASQALGKLVSLGPAEELEDEARKTQLNQHLWDACKMQVRPNLENLAERIAVGVQWDEMVLSELTVRRLNQIEMHVQNSSLVHGHWGFSKPNSRGQGTSVLFSGASGTGKTMAAEALATRLNLDLYRIDLSAVVSKYIGETEKNLSRIFDAAENGGVALLFDEADSLFGKRSEVKDARDRHANIEVSYLLQRLENFGGLAILTSNLKDSIDHAFLRRIRYIVDFPFPDAQIRQDLWICMLSGGAPLGEIDYTKLARLNVAGGSIRNIVLNAAFIAAQSGPDSQIQMSHLRESAQIEYQKSERPLSKREVGDW